MSGIRDFEFEAHLKQLSHRLGKEYSTLAISGKAQRGLAKSDDHWSSELVAALMAPPVGTTSGIGPLRRTFAVACAAIVEKIRVGGWRGAESVKINA